MCWGEARRGSVLLCQGSPPAWILLPPVDKSRAGADSLSRRLNHCWREKKGLCAADSEFRWQLEAGTPLRWLSELTAMGGTAFGWCFGSIQWAWWTLSCLRLYIWKPSSILGRDAGRGQHRTPDLKGLLRSWQASQRVPGDTAGRADLPGVQSGCC